MPKRHHLCASLWSIALATLLFAACGGNDSETSTADESASAEAAAPQPETAPAEQPSAPDANAVTAPLTRDDIARWEKGIEGEMDAVRQAATKLQNARTGEDTIAAMMGVQEMATLEAGAGAAGLEPERYKFVRSNLSAVVQVLTPALGGIDTTMLSQAQRDELRQQNEAQLQRMQQEVPPDVVAAIKPRAVELRKKDLELVGARLKGAGM